MKKRVAGLLAILLLLALCACTGIVYVDTNGNPINQRPSQGGKTVGGVKIQKSETAQIEYEDFDNGYLKMQIPEGWTLEIPRTVTYSGYTFKVYNPADPDYLFEFSLGLSGFLKTEAARQKYASLYPSAVFGQLPAIDPLTTEQFYKVWNTSAKVANRTINQEFFVYLNEFEMIENLCKTDLGGDVIRGKFVNAENEPMQGLFTATVVDVGSYYMYGLDLAPLNSYHNIIMYAPDAEFINWQPIYDHCLSTIEFTDEFMKKFNKEQSSQSAAVQANAKIYNEISDMIMDSWEKRSSSYDIISQKRSDATLGYERVYDTETGEVYRAYNGFSDDYQGNRYQAIPDDMYTAPISGYIEK